MIPGVAVDRPHHFTAFMLTIQCSAMHTRTVGVNELSALVKELQYVLSMLC